MLPRIGTALAALMFLCTIGCATNIEVRTDFDQSADFAKYQTFAFAGMTDLNQAGVLNNNLTRKRIETALTGELAKKNLRQVERLRLWARTDGTVVMDMVEATPR